MTTERDRRNQTQYEVDQAEKRGLEKGRAEGLAEGEKIGEARGIEENKLATAKKMLALGLELDVISQVIGFSIEALKGLK